VIVPQHAPRTVTIAAGWGGGGAAVVGWSRTLYDAPLIASWAVLIVDSVLAVVGLISYARRTVR
jgi:hypothetical protein